MSSGGTCLHDIISMQVKSEEYEIGLLFCPNAVSFCLKTQNFPFEIQNFAMR